MAKIESHKFSWSIGSSGSRFSCRVVYMHVQLTNLLVEFECYLKINSSWKALSFILYSSIIFCVYNILNNFLYTTYILPVFLRLSNIPYQTIQLSLTKPFHYLLIPAIPSMYFHSVGEETTTTVDSRYHLIFL